MEYPEIAYTLIHEYVNHIICEDCLKFMGRLPDNSIDFVFADPPYGIGKANWDNNYPQGFEKQLLRISRKGVAITSGQENLGICIQNLGNEYKGVLSAWNINGMTYNKIGFGNWIPVVLGGNIKRGQDFFRFVILGDKPIHPSPKPIEFMIAIIKRFTEENDLILDPFLGSGTTAVACKQLNRRYIGIEINPNYCEIARKRLSKVQMDMFAYMEK